MMVRPLSWAVLAASLRRATPLHVNTRRGIGQQLCTAFTSVAAPALALDPRFPRVDEGNDKGSILTAKPLEWIRIKRQLDADESLQELADPNLRDSPGQRLSKVLRLEDAIRAMGPMLATADGRALAQAALASPAFETKAIKKAFNAYSDNVYYEKGDSDRANLYLLGGTPPSSKQTIQYMWPYGVHSARRHRRAVSTQEPQRRPGPGPAPAGRARLPQEEPGGNAGGRRRGAAPSGQGLRQLLRARAGRRHSRGARDRGARGPRN